MCVLYLNYSAVFNALCSSIQGSFLACNIDVFSVFFPPNHNEPTNHLALSALKNMCTYILSCFLSVVLSALSQRQLFWSLYDWYPSIVTMDLEYLIQKFAINGAFSSPKNNVCFFDFYSFDSVTFLLTINIEQVFFYYGIWVPLLFLHSFARCFLRTVPVMLPEGLSRGRRTCVGNDVSKAVICVGAFV